MFASTSRSVLLITVASSLPHSVRADQPYDPLAITQEARPSIELTVHDAARSRDVPLRLYLPAAKAPAPVVLFSHGLGGTRDGSAFLGQHWSARGYVAVFLQHPGSDDSVWRDKPLGQRMEAMRKAAGVHNFTDRIVDVPAVLDQLAHWDQEADHVLADRLDLDRVGMSGHSFGAVATQAVSGQSFLRGAANPLTDTRIKAAIAFSPSAPRRGSPNDAFAKVKIPWLLMTGTKDESIIGDQTAESRRAVFPALPPGDKYELVLDNAEHSAFTDRPLPGDREPRNPNHHRAILAVSTAFWDAYLRQDPAAKSWLTGAGPSNVLEVDDGWQMK